MIDVYCDGASRGNPGPSSIGVSIQRDNLEISSISKTIGRETNNFAEWTSLISALEECIRLNELDVKVYMDSELVVKQFLGIYKTKHENLIPLKNRVLELKKKFKSLNLVHIKRELNKRADTLANQALDKMSN